jgi:hypothetical protein
MIPNDSPKGAKFENRPIWLASLNRAAHFGGGVNGETGELERLKEANALNQQVENAPRPSILGIGETGQYANTRNVWETATNGTGDGGNYNGGRKLPKQELAPLRRRLSNLFEQSYC